MFAPRRKLEALAEAELHRLRLAVRGAAIRTVVVLFAVFLGLIALFLGAAALALALAQTYGAPLGALMTAGIVLVAAAFLALIARPLSRPRQRASAAAESRAARRELAADMTTVKALASRLERARHGPGLDAKPLLFGALTAGFVVGVSPRLQRMIFGGREPPSAR